MILQAKIAADAAQNAFQTSPDTVYGVLVGVLFVLSTALAYGIVKVVRAGSKERDAHKDEMKGIYEKHEIADTQKYQDMKALTEKVMVGVLSFVYPLVSVMTIELNVGGSHCRFSPKNMTPRP